MAQQSTPVPLFSRVARSPGQTRCSDERDTDRQVLWGTQMDGFARALLRMALQDENEATTKRQALDAAGADVHELRCLAAELIGYLEGSADAMRQFALIHNSTAGLAQA